MADDMTPGEIRRSIERIEGAQRDAHRAIDDRMAKLAADMVPTSLWTAQHQALADDVRHLADDWRESVDRIEKTSQERMATLRGEISGVRGEVGSVREAQAEHVTAHAADRSWSRSRTITVIAIIAGASATLIGAWIAAFAAAGGVR